MFIRFLFKCFFVFSLGFIHSMAFSDDLSYYIGGSLKANLPLKFYHLGWNEDNVCYPGMSNCPEGGPKGFAWIYQVISGWMNPGLGFQAGMRTHKNWRVELSVDGFSSFGEPETKFKGLYYLKEK